MIPSRIRQIAKATAIASALALLCILAYDRGAGVAFGVTTAWMLANLLIWTVVIRIALQAGEQKAGVGILLLAISAKLILLFGGVIGLKIFAPYTRPQLYGIIAGVSSILVVAFLKSLGSWMVASSKGAGPVEKEQSAKV